MRTRTVSAALFALFAIAGIVGCSNVGNENPISPEMMKEQGEKESAARAGFKPDTANRPGK